MMPTEKFCTFDTERNMSLKHLQNGNDIMDLTNLYTFACGLLSLIIIASSENSVYFAFL